MTGNYTLVEFMDYQCSPCRASRDKVNALLQTYPRQLRLVVRHLPLRMHPNAESAAVAAEAAREQSKFVLMHDALLTANSLTPAGIQSIAQKIGLNQQRFNAQWRGAANKRVAQDKKDAVAFGLNSTPSFLLCTPKGEVWHLNSLDQVKDIVR